MNDDHLEHVERQIAAGGLPGAPSLLRAKVLADAQRELRAARWDQRLGRAAVLALVLGAGINAAIAIESARTGSARLAGIQRSKLRPTLVETAVVVAEATDVPTARLFARQQAAMSGRALTNDESAAIEEAVRRSASRAASGNKG